MKNTYRIDGRRAYIELPDGECAVIDADDLSSVESHDGMWRMHHRYVELYTRGTWTKLRKVITDVHDNSFIVTHKDDDPLNCTRENLIIAPRGVHVQKRSSANKNNRTSGVRGITWHAGAAKWMARYCVGRRENYLGVYENLEDAKTAVEEARRKNMPLSQEALDEI